MYNQQKQHDDLIDKYRGMLEDYGNSEGIDLEMTKLSASQQRALDIFESGRNVLVIGAGGTGKSKLIKEIRYQTERRWPGKRIVITATTGIAAYNINGITINSFLGIGTGEADIDTLVKRVRKKIGIRERLKYTDILIIDEISMASAEIFEKINSLCQAIRRSSAPFGGIQVVLTGDLLQLSPVFNKNQKCYIVSRMYQEQDTRLIFESPVFRKYFTSQNTVNLTENFRQSDPHYIQTLMRIRNGTHTTEDLDLLGTRLVKNLKANNKLGSLPPMVHLVASNKQAQIINLTNLNDIKSTAFKYKSNFTEEGNRDVCAELTKELHNQFNQKGINEITLKNGARVMLIKNLSVEEGLVNGSVGTVTKFEFVSGPDENPYPWVKFDNGVERLIAPVEWELELSSGAETNVSKATQLPLMLCWAITIHKSQSLTLDGAIMDLSACFCEHQIYVALSRVRSLDGLYLESFDPKKIVVNEKVKAFLKSIEK